jgi:hypothetical protein
VAAETSVSVQAGRVTSWRLRRSKGRTASVVGKGLAGVTPRADLGCNKPNRLCGEQGVERLRKPEDAT